jgi:hypothetical protein
LDPIPGPGLIYKPVSIYNHQSQQHNIIKELPKNLQLFFHENHRFFEFFEITRTGGSFNSEFFFRKKQNQWLFDFKLSKKPKLGIIIYKLKYPHNTRVYLSCMSRQPSEKN